MAREMLIGMQTSGMPPVHWPNTKRMNTVVDSGH